MRANAANIVTATILPVTLIVVWEIAYRSAWLPTSQFASPTTIAETIGELIAAGTIQSHLAFSAARLLIGTALGTVCGAIVGITIALSPKLERPIGPTLTFLAGIPVVVWMPFWIALVGTGEAFRIGLVAIAAFFLNLVVALLATKRASRDFHELALLFEKDHASRLLRIYLPASLEQLFVSLRISLAFGWIILFFVEYAASQAGSEGLGWFVANSRAVGRIEQEFAGLVTLGVTAFVLDRVVGYTQRIVLRWSDTLDRDA